MFFKFAQKLVVRPNIELDWPKYDQRNLYIYYV